MSNSKQPTCGTLRSSDGTYVIVRPTGKCKVFEVIGASRNLRLVRGDLVKSNRSFSRAIAPAGVDRTKVEPLKLVVLFQDPDEGLIELPLLVLAEVREIKDPIRRRKMIRMMRPGA